MTAAVTNAELYLWGKPLNADAVVADLKSEIARLERMVAQVEAKALVESAEKP